MLNYKILSALLCVLFVCSSVFAAVTLSENGNDVTVSNGVITAVFDKSKGEMTSYRKNGGPNLLANGHVYYDLDGGFGHANIASGGTLTYQVIKNTPSHVDGQQYRVFFQ